VTWKLGNVAGQGFVDGDLWVARWVTTPKGKMQILMTVAGFRDMPEGRRKVILDRKVVDPPTCGYAGSHP
jgi:hypothetical protein